MYLGECVSCHSLNNNVKWRWIVVLRTCEIYVNIYTNDIPKIYLYINSFGGYEVTKDEIKEMVFIPDGLKCRTSDIEDDYFRRTMKYLDATLVMNATYEDTFFDFTSVSDYKYFDVFREDMRNISRLFTEYLENNPDKMGAKNMHRAIEVLRGYF